MPPLLQCLCGFPTAFIKSPWIAHYIHDCHKRNADRHPPIVSFPVDIPLRLGQRTGDKR